jgi:hypothetical protein
MASQKLPDCGVGVYAYLRRVLHHCGVLGVRFIPQELSESPEERFRRRYALHLVAITAADDQCFGFFTPPLELRALHLGLFA